MYVDENSPFNSVPHFILLRIFKNLPLIEQCLTVRMVCNNWWQNLPAERRLKSIYMEKYFVDSAQPRIYSQLISMSGGKWLRNLYFDYKITLITADILIPFADNCPNIRSITISFSEISDDAAAVLPRFLNLENLKLWICTPAIREAIRHLRLIKLRTTRYNYDSPDIPLQNFLPNLVAEPQRLTVLTGINFLNVSIDDCAAVMSLLIETFPNLRELNFEFGGGINNDQLDLLFELPLFRNFLSKIKRCSLIDIITNNQSTSDLPITGIDFPNLTSLDMRNTCYPFYEMDWTKSLISQLPCCRCLRHVNSCFIHDDPDLNYQILLAMLTQMPELRSLKIYIINYFEGDISELFLTKFMHYTEKEGYLMIDLKNLRHLSLTGSCDSGDFFSIDGFLKSLACSVAPIRSLNIFGPYPYCVESLSLFKLLSLKITVKDEEFCQTFFLSTWPSLRNLMLESSVNPFDYKIFRKHINADHIERAFPRLIVFECGGKGIGLRALVARIVRYLPRLRSFIRSNLFDAFGVYVILNYLDNITAKLLARSPTLRHFAINTTAEEAVRFQNHGYFLMRDVRRQQIRETGIFPGELEIVISFVGAGQRIYKIGGLSG